MKFMMLVYGDSGPAGQVLPAERVHATADEHGLPIEDWVDEMDSRKVRLMGDQLRPPAETTSVRIRGGEILVVDGPFAETKEAIAGFDLLECADLDEAIEVAAKHPVARFGRLELRELWEE
jgi:hypothetical protein